MRLLKRVFCRLAVIIYGMFTIYIIFMCAVDVVCLLYIILYEMKYLKQIHSIRIRVKFEHTTHPDVVNGGDVCNIPEAR